jgi:hypothetical protein
MDKNIKFTFRQKERCINFRIGHLNKSSIYFIPTVIYQQWIFEEERKKTLQFLFLHWGSGICFITKQ